MTDIATIKEVIDRTDAERERRDRIVAAALLREEVLAELRAAELKGEHDVAQVQRIRLKNADFDLHAACKPIKPPYKPLLSDGELRDLSQVMTPEHMREIGAAALEAMADAMMEADPQDTVTLGWVATLRVRARKEREYAKGEM